MVFVLLSFPFEFKKEKFMKYVFYSFVLVFSQMCFTGYGAVAAQPTLVADIPGQDCLNSILKRDLNEEELRCLYAFIDKGQSVVCLLETFSRRLKIIESELIKDKSLLLETLKDQSVFATVLGIKPSAWLCDVREKENIHKVKLLLQKTSGLSLIYPYSYCSCSLLNWYAYCYSFLGSSHINIKNDTETNIICAADSLRAKGLTFTDEDLLIPQFLSGLSYGYDLYNSYAFVSDNKDFSNKSYRRLELKESINTELNFSDNEKIGWMVCKLFDDEADKKFAGYKLLLEIAYDYLLAQIKVE
jgi:hypothetical protein